MRRDKGQTLQESRVVEIINSPYSQMEPPSYQAQLDFDAKRLQSYMKEKSLLISERGAIADRISPGVLKSLITLSDKPKIYMMLRRSAVYLLPCPKYPDIEIYLICFNCTNCSAELWIRTDPESKDYVVEFGATKKHVEEDDDQVFSLMMIDPDQDKQDWR
ncbi:hypothetical protein SO802_009209 [Lithocarpus litseifolius]|uniref:Uncharacterized protein n=1 Tax=Lithocarpus litseifolius TaxID=425828 RepID=A0AAW2DBA9_9ROSI